MKAFDLTRFQRLVGVEGDRVRGTFWVLASNRGGHWVKSVDVTIWDEGRNFGRTLVTGDVTAEVRDGVADLPPHMIASNKRDDVLDVMDEMRAALVAAAAAFAESDVSAEAR